MARQSPAGFRLEKSSAMYLLIVGLWLACLAWFGASFYQTFQDAHNLAAKVLFAILSVFLALFWLSAFHHIVSAIFWLIERRKGDYEGAPAEDAFPRVALFYTSANDFVHEAALTCVRQDYTNYHVFLLDDSTDEEAMKQIDAFHEEFSSLTTVVRRKDRRGFKAGNVNNAVSTVAKDYEFFAGADSDSYLPPDFLTKTVRYFALDERIAFVQGNNRADRAAKERFQADLQAWVRTASDYYNIPRNRYGMVWSGGHGIVVRRSAWESVGGYPQVVGEDTAFSLNLRRQGYHGYFAREAVCGEEFPRDVRHWRRRYFRWVRADLECLLRHVLPFLLARNVTLGERLDALLRMGKVPVGFLSLPFVLGVAILSLLEDGDNLFWYCATSGVGLPGAWVMIVLSLLTGLAPFLPLALDWGRRPLTALRMSSQYLMLYWGVVLLGALGVLVYLLTRRVRFTVTGATALSTGASPRRRGLLEILTSIEADHPAIRGVEIALALFLAAVAFLTLNLVLLAIALSLALVPLLTRFGWQSKPLSALVFLPVALIVVGVLTGISDLLGPRDQYVLPAALPLFY